MNDEKHIDDDKKVVGVPKGIETGELLEGFGEFQPVPSEPWLSQNEGYSHKNHHHHPGPSLSPFHEPPIIVGPLISKKLFHGLVFFVRRM